MVGMSGHVLVSRAARLGALVAAVVCCSCAALASSASATGNGAMAWGENAYGQLGVTSERWTPPFCGGASVCTPVLRPVHSPAAVIGLSGVVSMSAGYTHTLALVEGGTVMAWGRGQEGQLGIGGIGPEECEESSSQLRGCSALPLAVEGLSGVTAVAAGGFHSLALLEDGTVMAWGQNAYGQLGLGSTSGPETCEDPGTTLPHPACSLTPRPVPGLSGVKAIAASAGQSYALLEDGTVMSWGENDFGELGYLGEGPSLCGEGEPGRCVSTPTPIKGLTGVTAIAAGEHHALALLSNGTVVSWGNNDSGELGDGTQEAKYEPTPVSGLSGLSGLSGVVSIGAGAVDSLALMSDGTIWEWGSNELGELGDGTNTGPERCNEFAPNVACSTVPVEVPGLSTVTQMAAGFRHTLALLEDGTVRAWGFNEFGALGVGEVGPEGCDGHVTPRCSRVPVTVEGLTGVSAIAVNAGADDSIAFGPLTPTVTAVEGSEAAPAAVRADASGASASAKKKAPNGNTGPESGGSSVKISGSDFSGATSVRFGSSESPSFSVSASGTLTAISPPGTGTVDITVTTPRGQSATGASDQFRYLAPPPPELVKVSPNKGPSAGGTVVTITGTGLQSATAVNFGSTAVTGFERSATAIVVSAPPGIAGTTVDVTVTSPSGTSVASSKYHFKYEGPTITSVSPASGSTAGGQTVTISGSGFASGDGTTVFKFGKALGSSASCSSSTICTVVSPPGKAGAIDVTATVGKSKSKKQSGDKFSYEAITAKAARRG
jgi:alpha-tubulin suppressor-like RCC1 family protein